MNAVHAVAHKREEIVILITNLDSDLLIIQSLTELYSSHMDQIKKLVNLNIK